MGVTLKQLAEEAKVSMATVSLALNGSPNVAAKTRDRILKLALKHHYQPNLIARSLAGGSSKLFGVLIDSRAPRIQFQLVGLIERVAAQYGYRVMIGEAHDSIEHLHAMYQTFRQYSADGIICLAHDYPGQKEQLRQYFENSRNLVFIGRPQLESASFIEIDRSTAIRQAVRHMYEQGYRRIGMTCSAAGYQSGNAKIAAFLAAQKELGTTAPENLVYRIDSPYDAGVLGKLYEDRLRDGHFDALLANSDAESAAICKFLQKKGVNVPDEFGLIGFDDEEFCLFTTPELSSINDELQLQAEHSVRMLLDMLADKQEAPVQRSVTVRSNLIIRESSCRNG